MAALPLNAPADDANADSGFPPTYHVTVDERGGLQSLLLAHRNLVLDANRDYRSPAVSELQVSSGMRIEGGWNTRVPQIVIEPGASHVKIVQVRSDALSGPDVVFAAGKRIEDVDIIGGSGGIGTAIHVKVADGAHLHRVRVSQFGGLIVDQAHSGSVRDSVFAGLLGYWPGPHVSWTGNRAEPSGSNLFLGMNSVTPQKGSSWRDVGDLWWVNADCESWNLHDHDQSECFRFKGATTLVSLGLSGGTSSPQLAGALARFDDVDALVSWFLHGKGGTRDAADLYLANVRSATLIQNSASRILDDAPPSPTRADLLGPHEQQSAAASAAPASGALKAMAALTPPPAGLRRPERRILAADDRSSVAFAADQDASIAIQRRIDREGIVRLAPGTYYLDHPLKLGSGTRTEGLLGDDEAGVRLVARGDFPVIEGRGNFVFPTGGGDATLIYLVLDRLTIESGSFGINWTSQPDNFGSGATVAFSSFSNLTFAHQKNAGINVEGIHGIDANFWYRVDFVDMPIAIRGRGKGIGAAMNYADKQSFVDCQFQDIGQAVWDWGSDRPSGGELWIDSYFYNVGQISRTRSATSLLWANDVIDNVAGDVGIHVLDDGSTATDYFIQYDCLWKGRAPKVVTDSQSFGIGTLFVRSRFEASDAALVARAGAQAVSAWDSTFPASMTSGAVAQGLFVNSPIGDIRQPVEIYDRGTRHAFSAQ